MAKPRSSGLDKEFVGANKAYQALKDLSEAEQRRALRFAAEKLGLGVDAVLSTGTGGNVTPTPPFSPVVTGIQQIPGGSERPAVNKQAAKAFLKTKAPTSDVQRVACLAYFLLQEGIDSFKSKDLSQLNRDGHGMTVHNMSQAVENSFKADWLSQAGKGRKKITGLGEQVVEALPDQEAVRAVLAGASRRTRRRRKGSGSGK
jgi:hypothetical protein